MFNIKRFDPLSQQQSSAAGPSNTAGAAVGDENAGLDALALKIQQRKNNKRKANHDDYEGGDAALPVTVVESKPIAVGEGEWKPADGESPAEREKRLKREKRIAKLGYDPYASSHQMQEQQSHYHTPSYNNHNTHKASFTGHTASQPVASTSTSALPPPPPPPPSNPNTNSTGEWQPAPGESPAEREKRIKREKRALKLGLPPPPGSAGAPPPSNDQPFTYSSHYVPPPSGQSAYPNSYTTPAFDQEPSQQPVGLTAIHPDRLAAPALAKTIKSKKPQEKTPARLRYLKNKKNRAKGRKKGMKKDGHPGTSEFGTEAGTEVGGDSDDDVEDDDDDDAKSERPVKNSSSQPAVGTTAPKQPETKDEEKLRIIAEKKAERKAKRDAKKAEIRKLKAEGGVIPPTLPRVIANRPNGTNLTSLKDTSAASPQKAEDVPMKSIPTPLEPMIETQKEEVDDGSKKQIEPMLVAEPTEEQLESQKEEEARLARKEAKRQKREMRKSLKKDDSTTREVQDDDEVDDDAPMLIPTGAGQIVPVLNEGEVQMGVIVEESVESKKDKEQVKEKEEAIPLMRLPGATRPEPPSKKTLSDLNVHESVRNKRIVDPELKVPIVDPRFGLSDRGRTKLGEMGIVEAFAVQTEVLPILLPKNDPTTLYAPFRPPRDLCVSAPTGSGKTLSYVVPIVETLAPRIVTRLRALVILPTRDLVGQVRETFEAFSKGLGLNIGTATGQHSFTHEQSTLVGDDVPEGLQGGSSLVDILIATPGRLMDHIRSTPGFSLQHLRYLVVDEADRLLTQSFNEWLPSVLAALQPPPSLNSSEHHPKQVDLLAPAFWDINLGRIDSELDTRALSSCQKLLFSATLSRDPAKIDSLHLYRPIYVSVEDALDPHAEDEAIDQEMKFTFPTLLTEHMIISPSTHKPLYLLHLLHQVGLTSALCFTKSVEAAMRLAKLVEFVEEARLARIGGEEQTKAGGDDGDHGVESARPIVKAYSSDLAPAERTRLLAAFKKGEIQMLICSDLISRGIDLPDVSHVLSYDIPADMRKYVHRVGRTARAGKRGAAWSLVEDQEVAPFKAMMKAASHWDRLKRIRVKEAEIEPLVQDYQIGLKRLRSHFATGMEKKREAEGAL